MAQLDARASPEDALSWLDELIGEAKSDCFALYGKHVDPWKARSAHRLGFSQPFVRGRGARLFDAGGRAFLDFEAGNAVFAIGRNHPRLTRALSLLLASEPPNWVARNVPELAARF